MSVQVDFGAWGPIWLEAGAEEVRWFTWAFDEDHWSLMQATPRVNPPDGMGGTFQIVEQWMERANAGDASVTRHWCRVKNIGTSARPYVPTAIMVPGRF